MSTPLIVISSRTGNTMALGHAVADALPGALLVRASELPEDLTPYNPVLLGFWRQNGTACNEIKRVAAKLAGKTIACFATMGGDPDDEGNKAWMKSVAEELTALGPGNQLAATYLCRGRIAPEMVSSITAIWGRDVAPDGEARARVNETHPDRLDLLRAAELFRGFFGQSW